jgi:hypothetical protein
VNMVARGEHAPSGLQQEQQPAAAGGNCLAVWSEATKQKIGASGK